MPTEERSNIYCELPNVKDREPYHDIIIIMGDLNGYVKQDRHGIENVTGAFSIGWKDTSGDGIIGFCVQSNMRVMNTFYFKENHKWIKFRCNNARKRKFRTENNIDFRRSKV